MLLAMARDIRVILVKLCDRLDNMRSLQSPATREAGADRRRDDADLRAAREPARDPMGQGRARGPRVQVSLSRRVRAARAEIAKNRAERLEYIHHVEKLIQKEMSDNGVPCEVTGRAKHLWSIYQKMKRTQRPFERDPRRDRVPRDHRQRRCTATRRRGRALGVDADPGPVRLHRAAQAEHVPVAAPR